MKSESRRVAEKLETLGERETEEGNQSSEKLGIRNIKGIMDICQAKMSVLQSLLELGYFIK